MSVEQEGGYRSEEERQAAEEFDKETEKEITPEASGLSKAYEDLARLNRFISSTYEGLSQKALEIGGMSEQERTRFEADYYLRRIGHSGPGERSYAGLNRGRGEGEEGSPGLGPTVHISPGAEEIIYDTLGVDKEAVRKAMEKVQSGESDYETIPVPATKEYIKLPGQGGESLIGLKEIRVAKHGNDRSHNVPLTYEPIRGVGGRRGPWLPAP